MPLRDLAIQIVADPSTDLRWYNISTVQEVTVIIPGDHTLPVNPHNIILHQHEGNLQFIHNHHHAYASLHYVLLFPYGTTGWTNDLLVHANSDRAFANRKTHERHITQVQFYSYHLHIRQDEYSTQFEGCLFQQYVCNMWVSTDQSHLQWVKMH